MQTVRPVHTSAWWAYFWFSLCFTTLGVVLGTYEGPRLLGVVANLSAVLALLAMYGYIKQRPLLARSVWVAYAATGVPLTIGSTVYPFVTSSGPVDGWLLPVLLLFLLPSLWAAIAYAFLSPHVWAAPRVGA